MSQSKPEDEGETTGWDAIESRLRELYGDREPSHFGTVVPFTLGGRDPLQGISVYKNHVPEPHYHYVTFGFSELYEKESDGPEVSGYGFELTFRLACRHDDPEEPPTWPLNFLQNLARYIFQTGNPFDEKHHLSLNGPISLQDETEISAITLILDPELGELATPNGSVKFLQIVGLCGSEYDLVQQGYFSPVVDRVVQLAPLAITNLGRASILTDPSVREAITSNPPEVTQREVFGTIVQWEETSGSLELVIGATTVPQLKNMLRAFSEQGESIAVYGNNTGLVFQANDSLSWEIKDPLVIVSMPRELARYFAENLQAERGQYKESESSRLQIRVAPVNLRDGDGKIVETVG